MKALKGFLNFFGIVLAVVLSVVLLVSLLLTPVISSATNIVAPKTIHKTIKKTITSIDYEKVLQDNYGDVLEENNVDTNLNKEDTKLANDTIQGLMETETMDNIIELYSQDISAALNGKTLDEKNFTQEKIEEIINENIDEISDIAFDLSNEKDAQITKEQIKSELSKKTSTIAENFSKALPKTEEIIDVTTMNEQTFEVLKNLASGKYRIYVYIAVLILSLLVFGCRFMRFKGFMWLSVVYILGALSAFGTRFVSKVVIEKTLSESLPFAFDIIAPAVDVALSQFIVIGVVLLVLAAAFIATFVFGRKYLAKKQTLATVGAPTLPNFPEEATTHAAPAQVEEPAQAEETVQTETPASEEA